MIKVLVQIKDNIIYFKIRKKINSEYKSIINTNIISDNELIFSDEYILKNPKLVATFIRDLTSEYHIDTCYFESYNLSLLLLNIIRPNSNIHYLIFKEDNPLPYKVCSKILKMNYIKTINIYNLQDFMIEYLDKKNIKVESRSEILFLSHLMEENNLNNFSSIYYKNDLVLTFPLSINDEDDFEAFCDINKYLKVIHLNNVVKNDLEFIINTLKKEKIKNIKIIIHQNINNELDAGYLKDLNYKNKKEKIRISLQYSNKYLEKNLLPEANNKILKICFLIILAIIVASFCYVFIDNYNSLRKDEEIQNEIVEIIEKTDGDKIIEDINQNIEKEEDKITNPELASLLNNNEDVVGWLKVNNTNIDYPVVQANDNDFYLNHNFKKDKDYNGWIFMDFRNNSKVLDDNAIIYGHNRYSSGVMFGTLKNTLNEEWYTNKENLVITFNTLYKEMKWQVFSIYKIDVTTDYLYVNFDNSLDRLAFYQKLEARSLIDFDQEIHNDDKIITLSTCINNNTQRLVLHAVLINN